MKNMNRFFNPGQTLALILAMLMVMGPMPATAQTPQTQTQPQTRPVTTTSSVFTSEQAAAEAELMASVEALKAKDMTAEQYKARAGRYLKALERTLVVFKIEDKELLRRLEATIKGLKALQASTSDDVDQLLAAQFPTSSPTPTTAQVQVTPAPQAVQPPASSGTTTVPAKDNPPTQTQQLGTLVKETVSDGDSPKTVWELKLPKEPGEKSRLSLKRLEYGLSLINDADGSKLFDFIKAFSAINPPVAWQQVEDLVLAFTNGRALSDPLPIADPRIQPGDGPTQVHIITKTDELYRYFQLKPEEMKPVLWGNDPLVKGYQIKQRRDVIKYIASYNKKIDEIYKSDPKAAASTKTAMLGCVNQQVKTDNVRCADKRISELMFIWRNHGAGPASVGSNESYDPKTTNVPDAQATVWWNDYLKTYQGFGWECGGNPLEFFTNTVFMAGFTGGNTSGKPDQVRCELRQNGQIVNAQTPPFVLVPEGDVEFAGNAAGGKESLQLTGELFLKGNKEATFPNIDGTTVNFSVGPQLTKYYTGTYPGSFDISDQFGRRSSCPFSVEVKKVEAPPTPIVETPPAPTSACSKCAAQNKTFRVDKKNGLTLNVSDFVPRGTSLKPGTAKWTLDGNDAGVDSKLHVTFADLQKKGEIQFTLEVQDESGCVIRCNGHIKSPSGKWWIAIVVLAAVVGVVVATHKGGSTAAAGVKSGQKPGDGK